MIKNNIVSRNLISTVLYCTCALTSYVWRSPSKLITQMRTIAAREHWRIREREPGTTGVREGSKRKVFFFFLLRGCNFGSERAEKSLFGDCELLDL
jgi:hypothetical protein